MPAKKKTPAKKETPAKRRPEPRPLNAMSEDNEKRFNSLIRRLHNTPEFDALVLLLKDLAYDAKEERYAQEVIKSHPMTAYHTGIEYSYDNLVVLIETVIAEGK